ncbi:MAG: hypothetical protein ACO25B_04015 [Chitinophagaceae bacterium]
MKQSVKYFFSFVLATVLVCIANFIIQILIIFADLVTRLESSSVMVIVLWIVTGVFGAVFCVGIGEHFVGLPADKYRQAGNTVLVVSLLAIAFAVFFLSRGLFRRDPKEFSLLLSNGYVFIAYFTGASGMALIMRNLD